MPGNLTTNGEPPDGGDGNATHETKQEAKQGEGNAEQEAERTTAIAPLDLAGLDIAGLDIADLGTQLLAPPDTLQSQRVARARLAQEHDRRATQLLREVEKIQEAERELAALEHELDVFWRTPSGLLSEEGHDRIRELSGLITEQRHRLRHAAEYIADRIARAQRHEAAAAQLRTENTRE